MNSFSSLHILLFILDDTLAPLFFFLLLSLLVPCLSTLPILLHLDFMFTCNHMLDSEMQCTKFWHFGDLAIPSYEKTFPSCLPQTSH